MIIEILAWVSVLAIPAALLGIIIYGISRTFRKSSAPSALKDMIVENSIPEWKSIDEASFLEEEEPAKVEAGMRVYRIYRSVDRITWAECDPALTERAACNYADYIKRSNPNEFVRCEDPNGLILFYE